MGFEQIAEVSHVLQHTRDTLHELRRYLAQAGYREILDDIETLVATAEDEARRELGWLNSKQVLPTLSRQSVRSRFPWLPLPETAQAQTMSHAEVS